jgi:preprotein translocase subunit SecD
MALVGTMIGTGNHKPQLGIDLAGGTTMVMTAKGPTPSPGDMDTALQIMRNRVNGQGVSEAQVTKQGGSSIEVDLPGKNSSELLQELGQTAKLYFRVVVMDPTQYGVQQRTTPAPQAVPPTTPSPSGSSSSQPSGSTSSKPSSGSSTPSAKGSSASSSKPGTPSSSATSTQHRVTDAGLKAASTASGSPASTPSTPASPSGTATASSKNSASSAPSTPASNPSSAPSAPGSSPNGPSATTPDGHPKDAAPSPLALQTYATIDCNHPPSGLGSMFADYQFSVGCDYTYHTPYLLQPADVDGKDLSSASANAEQAGGANAFLTGAWEVDLSFNGKGAADFGRVTTQLNGTQGTFAVDLDGIVYSAATVQQPITDGNARITSNSFTQKTAENLANVLKYGSLPITFDQGNVSQVSASLAGNQLAAGLVAGGIGMVLVIAYLIAYYRGLSIVAVASLLISGILTYALATLLGPAMGFRLSLAGVAGLVVAIGITADSFVIFFERLRDEVREGRTLRTAVDHGWTRARRTIISSDFVSFLAAFVLYEVSIGTVQGFAFTLGLTTLLDILVVFTFTKPIVTLLARRRFFNEGHPWSGLDPNRLGVKKSPGIRQTIVDRRAAARKGSAEGMEA